MPISQYLDYQEIGSLILPLTDLMGARTVHRLVWGLMTIHTETQVPGGISRWCG